MTELVVKANNLQYSYPDGTNALREISFEAYRGQSLAITGANGAGKSTLLLHLNGLLTPTSGTLTIQNIALGPKNREEVQRRVGLVFQNPDDQLFMPTVWQDVTFGPLNLGLDAEEVSARATEALNQVDALHLKERPPYRLSAGEKRRVALATVLAMQPDILVLDEPTTGLDPCSRRQLIQLLNGFGHTLILASHDLDLVMEVCERTLVLHEGKIAGEGPTSEIFTDGGLLQRCHLEKPLGMRGCPLCGRMKP
ncbi:MAG: energy-coupling factor ABC transporter ATP-binding protein [Desulfuromonadales bacterium]